MDFVDLIRNLEIVQNALARVIGAMEGMKEEFAGNNSRETTTAPNYSHSEKVSTALPSPGIVSSQPNKKETDMESIFTKKELNSMPKLKDFSYRHRKQDGIFEFRYRRNGINKSFSSADFKEARRKAIEFCKMLSGLEDELDVKNGMLFNNFAYQYINSVKRPNVALKTYENDLNRFEKHIKPRFEGLKLTEIRAPLIQRLLNGLIEEELFRTAEGCYYLLKTIFDYAVNNDYMEKSPMRAVKIPLHIRKNGSALPITVEKEFLQKIKGHKYELNFIILLYTGCRPCELESLCFETPGFITFKNRKQKKNVVKFKDVPISPMLEPYIDRIKRSMPLPTSVNLSKIFSSIVPGFPMYSLRHTFATRCQTCGVPQEIVSRWLGHSLNSSLSITDRVYTHFSPEFMLEIVKKVKY